MTNVYDRDDNTPALSTCPECKSNVYLCAVKNQRNEKWTVLPVEVTPTPPGEFADFNITFDLQHEAVDIMGEVVGEFPVAMFEPGQGRFRPHSPSHYLGHDHGVS